MSCYVATVNQYYCKGFSLSPGLICCQFKIISLVFSLTISILSVALAFSAVFLSAVPRFAHFYSGKGKHYFGGSHTRFWSSSFDVYVFFHMFKGAISTKSLKIFSTRALCSCFFYCVLRFLEVS